MTNLIQIKDRSLIQNGKPITLRGTSFGNWLMIEEFMSGIPYVEHKMIDLFREVLGDEIGSAFFKHYRDTYITEADVEYLAGLGVNFVRFPFNYRLFESDLDPGNYLETGFEYIDRTLTWCRKHNIFLMLDLHAAPGCQALDWNVDNANAEALLWLDRNYQLRTFDLWKAIAARYKDEPLIMGYEVLNEPVAPEPTRFDNPMLQRFYRELIAAVRKVDPSHIIVLNANAWGRDIESLSDDLFEDPQTMYEAHYYPYERIPFPELKEYPCELANRDLLEKKIKERLDEDRIVRPTLFGEFGIQYDKPFITDVHYRVLADVLDIFNENGYHWAIWSYKDLKSMGFVNPRPDTPWLKFLNRPDIKAQREKLDDVCSVNYAAGAPKQSVFFDLIRDIFPELDFKYTQHRVREARRNMECLQLYAMLLKMKEYTKQDILAMAESFKFQNCKINKKAESTLKSALTSS